MLFSFTACSEQSPSEVTKEALAALKSQDAEAFNALYAGEPLDFTPTAENNEEPQILTGERFTAVMEKLLGFDYEIGKETITDDSATVEITITTYDFGQTLESAASEVMSQVLELTLSGTSEKEINLLVEEALLNAFDQLLEKAKTTTANVNLTKSKGGWSIDNITENQELADALTGGAYSVIMNMSDIFSGIMTE
ncbi:MAG: hypothetical protein U0M15_05375 [Bacillota bacterium]|nr:hypothetical protein [Bacillota bacterium]